MAQYRDIFSPETLNRLNQKSADSLQLMVGNRNLMQVMMSSQDLLNDIISAEAPYKARLENLATQIVKEKYPILDQENINIDAKITSLSDVERSLDEATPDEKRRRVINAITQGASVIGVMNLFRIFRNHLDEINPSLYDKYNQIMNDVFGIYDNDDAIALMLAAVAQGQKLAGGSSKIIISEALGIRARAVCFPMLVHELIKGYYGILGQSGLKGDRDTKQATVRAIDKLENEPEDIRYGKFIYKAVNNIFLAFAGTDDSRTQSFFFQDVYKLEDDEFFSFVENAINENLTPSQIQWVQDTIQSIEDDLRSDDYGASGVSEVASLTDLYNLLKEESTQYNIEGQLLTNTEERPQKDILSDIRSLPGVTIVSSKEVNPNDNAFSNPNYYTLLKIKIDPHPFSSGFKDDDLQKLFTDIRAIKGVRNFKLNKPVEKKIV
jgi:hypothetical protein